jgi:zinc transport system substrate-binding protein
MQQIKIWPGLARAALLGALAALAACGVERPAPAAFTVVAEFYPIYVETLNVVGDTPGVDVANMVPTATGCPEDYQLRPGDLQTLSAANVFIVNGAGLEGYLDKIAAQFSRVKVVNASADLPLLTIDGELNPHVWVSPALAARQTRAIAAALAAADPAHASLYQKNGEAYAAKLAALAARLRENLAAAPIHQIVAFHDSMPYLARDLGLDILAVMEPAPGQNPSPRDLADVVARVRSAHGPVALLTEIDSTNPAAEIISRDLNQPLYQLDTVTGGPLDPVLAKDAYLQAMEKNLVMLRTALGLDKKPAMAAATP